MNNNNNNIIFKTSTDFDFKAITTFGVSVKKAENPIGYFGTGLKFAIAIILRHGLEIKLVHNKETYLFSTKKEKFRDTEITSVYMNDQILPFSLELGKNWELWQAYRELYCNTIDENGTIYEKLDNSSFESNCTYFIVSGKAFNEVHQTKSDFILQTKPIYENEFIEIHENKSKAIFYKGIKVLDLDKVARFTYNFKKDLQLSEDRLVKDVYSMYKIIASGIVNADLKLFKKICFALQQHEFEYLIDFQWSSIYVPLETKNLIFSDINDIRLYPPSLIRRINTQYPETTEKAYKKVDLTNAQKKALTIAIEFTETIVGCTFSYEIVIVENLGAGIIGRANFENKLIYLSIEAFKRGQRDLNLTVLEEFIHLYYIVTDETREMQNQLFNIIANLYEELHNP